ncbi:glycosyl hydrolase [Lunatibacter salilacus]|uniref:glycosyl hydrolase n=1 Tax=Lunatibacter salilacus TaxID=2483804 RepID=UPI00131C3B45|nr:glycosyl hydrolase [Lunatibacter salilacus]
MNRTITQDIPFLFVFTALLIGLNLFGCHSDAQVDDDFPAGEWPEITSTAKPWSRWWWMGNAVDKQNLSILLKEYHEAGIGGLEIAPIYGAKGYEDRFIEFLSPEWLEMLHYTVGVADSLEMGIDLTQGTGWPFGGPMVTPEMAATRMMVQQHSWRDGELDQPIQLQDERAKRFAYKLESLMAFSEHGEALEVTDKVSLDGSLNWEQIGNWSLWAIFRSQTGQLVKRAAPGGQGFTLDHYSAEAVRSYLSHFDQSFVDQFPGIRAFYNDSFEVYGADFTAGFFEFFEKKRGYDLKRHLPELLTKEPNQTSARLKSDYRETIHEMLLENFTQQWTNWAHEHGRKTKNQAHGSPGNLLDLYATVDIPEAETFGSSHFPIPGLRRDSADIRNVDPDPIMLKFASSAAHLTGKKLVSTETFTWLGEHFKSSFSQAKPELEQAFLAGINHMFYHGITYSPQDVEFPGWLFYASLNLTTHNSLWSHFRGFNDFVARSQAVLQSGNPSQELLMYWPIYDVWADPKGLSRMITVHNIDEWLQPTPFYKESAMLMEKGYAIDFVSDALLDQLRIQDNSILSGGNKAKAILIPSSEHMPLETLQRLLELVRQGATVIFQEVPKQVPGFLDVEVRLRQLESMWDNIDFDLHTNGIQSARLGEGKIILTKNFENGLESVGIYRESLTDTGLKFIRRESDQGTYYYLVNHTAKKIDQWIPLRHKGKSAILLDPQQGSIGMAESKTEKEAWNVRVQIPSGESLIVQVLANSADNVTAWPYINSQEEILALDGPWKLSFGAGGPDKPEDQTLERLMPWTELEDKRTQSFSGIGTYESNFTIEKNPAEVYILNLGTVHESAKVWINGSESGHVFGLHFKLNITEWIHSGENTVRIEVANLMANRIRDMDRKGLVWRNYHEINFVNIDYKPFDASNWEIMPSGLAGPTSIDIYR